MLPERFNIAQSQEGADPGVLEIADPVGPYTFRFIDLNLVVGEPRSGRPRIIELLTWNGPFWTTVFHLENVQLGPGREHTIHMEALLNETTLDHGTLVGYFSGEGKRYVTQNGWHHGDMRSRFWRPSDTEKDVYCAPSSLYAMHELPMFIDFEATAQAFTAQAKRVLDGERVFIKPQLFPVGIKPPAEAPLISFEELWN